MAAASATKAVIFDIGRVLFQWDMRYLFAKLIAEPAALDRFLDTVITLEWHFQHDAGRPLDAMIAERMAQFPGHDALFDAYRHRFNETIPGPVPGSIAIVEQLSAAGVPLYVISNFGADLWHGFRPTQPIFDRFAGFVISGIDGVVKPDPAIYRLALNRFGLDAADTLFIDDVAANVAGAESVGIAAHQFTDAATARRWLRGHGLPV
jgi:2-haloacid dehalogenase